MNPGLEGSGDDHNAAADEGSCDSGDAGTTAIAHEENAALRSPGLERLWNPERGRSSSSCQSCCARLIRNPPVRQYRLCRCRRTRGNARAEVRRTAGTVSRRKPRGVLGRKSRPHPNAICGAPTTIPIRLQNGLEAAATVSPKDTGCIQCRPGASTPLMKALERSLTARPVGTGLISGLTAPGTRGTIAAASSMATG